MKISILGTNGFLSTAIAKYAVAEEWTLEMYGLQRPDDHDCNLFHQVDLMDSEMDCSTFFCIYPLGLLTINQYIILVMSDKSAWHNMQGVVRNLKFNSFLIWIFSFQFV